MALRRVLAWLRQEDRPISSGVALASMAIALISVVVAALQAGLLFSQRATPYRTALYVRQLEVAGDFSGAAHEQWVRIINLHNDCAARLNGEVVEQLGDYRELARPFREGSQDLHKAYAGTLVTFPPEMHADARAIWTLNENLFDQVVLPAGDCRRFITLYRSVNAETWVADLDARTLAMVNDMRDQLGVRRLSWPEPIKALN